MVASPASKIAGMAPESWQKGPQSVPLQPTRGRDQTAFERVHESYGVYCFHERKYYTCDKPWVKKPEQRRRKKQRHKAPSADSPCQSETASQLRAFSGYAYPLQQEIQCRQTITSASRH